MVEAAHAASDIAIIGYHGRFPGADHPQAFWRNVRDGVDCLRRFTDEELQAHGVSARDLNDPNYVRVGAVLHDVEGFDAAFFGMTGRDAELMDPQQRLFLEVCWAALEHAGYDPSGTGQRVGIFAGARTNTYLFQLVAHPDLVESIGAFHLGLGNDLAFMVARVSHCLNLTGPSCALHTACSTSLVAVHLAAQSLLREECRMAIAGGVAVNVPHITGYLAEDGGVLSRDGRCRVFDAGARGTVFGSGVGVVVLKRLTDALDDEDEVHAILKGSAVNNDGAAKASFTAPAVRGQIGVITDALRHAGVSADSLDYVEAHGTGTLLGDAIEVRALTRAFQQHTRRQAFCALGSVKTNIGHLDAAAGVAGLIKVIESLKHEQLPPSLYYEQPNPQIAFYGSPFRVNTTLTPWPRGMRPRRAGVSAFGVGGTNAHAILEEAPVRSASVPGRPWQLLVWSGKSAEARETIGRQLAAHFRDSPAPSLADAAFTLQIGRQRMPWRRALVCRDVPEACEALEAGVADAEHDDDLDDQSRVVFVLPGQGAQRPGMGQELYAGEPVYREAMDRCAELLRDPLGLDLRDALFREASGDRLAETWLAQPALFATEYALITLWASWGIQPAALVGHSVGEYVAACIAGVLDLSDASRLVAIRGRLMHEMPRGAMLAVEIGEQAIGPWLETGLWVSAVNGADVCTIGGDAAAIGALEQRLRAAGRGATRLRTSHAFHTPLMAPMAERYAAEVGRVPRGTPQIPYASNLTGTWATEAEIQEPHAWSRQICEPVQFARGLDTALADGPCVVLEVGPGQGLTRLIRRRGDVAAYASLGHDSQSEQQSMMRAVGQLWAAGIDVDWRGVHAGARRQRVALPVYPFQHKRYWIDPPAAASGRPAAGVAAAAESHAPKIDDVTQWFWTPSWRRVPSRPPARDETFTGSTWLILADESALSVEIERRLRGAGAEVVMVFRGTTWQRRAAGGFAIDPRNEGHYRRLADAIRRDRDAVHVLHVWGLEPPPEPAADDFDRFEAYQATAFHSLILAAHALIGPQRDALRTFSIVSNEAFAVESPDRPDPARSPAATFCKILSQETAVVSRFIDVAFRDLAGQPSLVADRILRELADDTDRTVAYRGSHRWLPDYERWRISGDQPAAFHLRDRGVYLITGGLGGVGRIIATYLAETCRARVMLTSRSVSSAPELVEAIEAAGGEARIRVADAADPEQMRAAVQACVAELGALHGVVHAAGITSGSSLFRTIAEATPEDCRIQARPKIAGVYAIDAATRDLPLDFVLLLSSNAAVLGGLGFLSYAAANAAMDGFAARCAVEARGTRWISSNWDHWPQEIRKYLDVSTSMDEYAMTLDEAREALRLVLGHGEAGQIVIATGDLAARVALWLGSRRTAPRAVSAHPAGADRHPRPKLRSVFVAPAGDVEARIADVWSAFLEVAPIGRHDDFFELGGHSLMAIQLISEIGRVLNRDVPIRALFAGPTVAQLAQACTEYADESAVARGAAD